MPDPAPTPDELRALLAHLLAGAAGHDEAYWLGLIQIERTALVDDILTNWRLATKSPKRDRAAIESAEALVRGAHPYMRW